MYNMLIVIRKMFCSKSGVDILIICNVFIDLFMNLIFKCLILDL